MLDSGTISEESSILNFPALNLREAHGTPKSNGRSICNDGRNEYGADYARSGNIGNTNKRMERNLHVVSDYSKPNVSDKVLRIILSYIDYITVMFGKSRGHEESSNN